MITNVQQNVLGAISIDGPLLPVVLAQTPFELPSTPMALLVAVTEPVQEAAQAVQVTSEEAAQ